MIDEVEKAAVEPEVTQEQAHAEATALSEASKPIDQLSLTELAAEYNRRAEELEANDTGVKPLRIKRIKGFKDRTTGIRRLRELNGEQPPAPRKVREPKAAKAAPKAKAHKPAKQPKAKVHKPAKPAREYSSKIAEEFGFMEAGRAKVINILAAKMGRQIPRKEFGDSAQFLSKVTLRIKRNKLPYKLIKEKDDEGNSYGLHRKQH